LGKIIPLFTGFATSDISEAVAACLDKTGFAPRAIVVRNKPEAYDGPDILVETHFGIAGGFLLTHEIEAEELREYYAEKDLPKSRIRLMGTPQRDELAQASKGQKKERRGRPKIEKARCPHCQQVLRNFENLGFWHGWAEDKFPPYWGELTQYILERDDHFCQRCQKKFANTMLIAHHIEPKEHRGTDSARNLTTLCKKCHEIVHSE
jgi:uncharacterized protein with PIN domain